jgi:hypothetical protein
METNLTPFSGEFERFFAKIVVAAVVILVYCKAEKWRLIENDIFFCV